MALTVMLRNYVTENVSPDRLGQLLESRNILIFKRSDGVWVDPEVGPVRGGGGSIKPYTGPERRAQRRQL